MTSSIAIPTASVENSRQNQAELFYLLAAAVALLVPGSVLGAPLLAALWSRLGDPLPRRVCWVAITAWLAIVSQSLQIGWLFTSFIDVFSKVTVHLPSVSNVTCEALLAPALLLLLQAGATARRQTAFGQLANEREVSMKRARAMRVGYRPPTWSSKTLLEHPLGALRIGVDEFNQIFDLTESEIMHHLSIIGATGVGKTTTLTRLAHGSLLHEFSVVVVDCKGIGLGGVVRELAHTHRLPLSVVDPDSPDTTGYDPCTGSPAHVANKLVGAFTYSVDADIYKNIALEVLPIVVRALRDADLPVDIDHIYQALGKGGLARLARFLTNDNLIDRLQHLERDAAGIGRSGYNGLQHRTGALREGQFGSLFAQRPALDLDAATTEQSVTYLPLSTTAHSEDVSLFARVIIQDLKQLCARRLHQIAAGIPVRPTLVIFDEFAALEEAHQIGPLLLQAREARISIITATQFLPLDPRIRTPFLQSGVLICHRVSAEDADALAAEFGTHDVPEVTHQIDYETGYSQKGSTRLVKAYNIHPDLLKELPTGMAAVLSRDTNRRAVLRILTP